MTMTVLALLCAIDAFALERNSQTRKFTWGDDLNETVTSPGNPNYSHSPSQLKPNHLPDIKTAIDISVTACGVSSNVWSQSETQTVGQIGHPGSAVKASQVNALRRAIEALYTARNNNTISNYFTGSVSPGQPITKRHINDMRRALDDLVAGCAGPARTPLCWEFSSLECDVYPSMPCSNARACGEFRYTDGFIETDLYPCDGIFPGNPPTGWTACGSTCEADGQTRQVPFDPAIVNGAARPSTVCCSGQETCFVTQILIPPATVIQRIDCTCGTVPVCGNGSVESGEQCDDWNTSNGDGCSSTCQDEACIPDGTQCGHLILGISGSSGSSNCNLCCSGEFHPSGGGMSVPLVCGPAPEICLAPSCDSSMFGPVSGGTCGGCDTHGTTITTLGSGCRRYRCNNGNWIDTGSGAPCPMAASCI